MPAHASLTMIVIFGAAILNGILGCVWQMYKRHKQKQPIELRRRNGVWTPHDPVARMERWRANYGLIVLALAMFCIVTSVIVG
jgi:hypothetical protein